MRAEKEIIDIVLDVANNDDAVRAVIRTELAL
ncbi:aminoglycoside 6-adenylyltransferase [Butyrivibrio sp. ob235]|nr:aminoglycoside 6-adenylyltransferase [Butyrivibrio sp. ob235]